MNIFYNSLGDFQWASIAAILSFIGIGATVGASIYTNKKSLRAQMRSSTKIEWMNKIIDLSANYINDYELLNVDARQIFSKKVLKSCNTFSIKEDIITTDPIEAEKIKMNIEKRNNYDIKISEYSEDFNNRIKKINYTANQMSLYFMNNEESKILRELINELRGKMTFIATVLNQNLDEQQDETYYQQCKDNLIGHLDELDKAIEHFKDNMSVYLESELKKIEKIV